MFNVIPVCLRPSPTSPYASHQFVRIFAILWRAHAAQGNDLGYMMLSAHCGLLLSRFSHTHDRASRLVLGGISRAASILQLQWGDVEQVCVVMDCEDYDLAHALHTYANATQPPCHISQT